MVKSHQKRIFMPKSWPVPRKGTTFVPRPLPGAHSKETSFPILMMLKDVLGVVRTAKEAVYLLQRNEVTINGRRVYSTKRPVGFMDIVSLTKDDHYIVLIDKMGKLVPIKLSDKKHNNILSRIMDKSHVEKGKVQLNLDNGYNVLVDKDSYKTGDSIVVALDRKKIEKHLPLKEGATVYLHKGKHTGDSGKVEAVRADSVVFKSNSGEVVETKKEFAYVVTDDHPVLSQ